VAQQGPPPRRSSRQLEPGYAGRSDRSSRPDRFRRSERPDRAVWQEADPFGPEADAELPPWAGPGVDPLRPAGTLRRPAHSRPDDEDLAPAGYRHAAGDPGQRSAEDRPPRAGGRRRGRAAAARLRKSRRRVYRWCGIAIVACVIAAGITALASHHSPKPALYVTSLLPGEFKSVPNACSSVSTTVLDHYLPGPGRTSTSELADSTDSQCSFTVDRKPVFIVLELSAQAYQPFAAAGSGSAAGSATANAQDNYALVYQGLRKPPKNSPVSAAEFAALPGTGQRAFVAVQREQVSGGIVSDVVTIVIRQRNVLITVSESGQESGHGFGPVPVSELQSGAEAAARDMLATARTEPTA
jgi:hypothetical protein